MEKFNRDLTDFNVALASGLPATPNGSGGVPRLAAPPQNPGKSTQLIVPTDKTVAQAMDDALPLVKKVVAIHQCSTSRDSLRLLNAYGVPGSNFQYLDHDQWPGAQGTWRHHDPSICPSVQVIDQWTMPALNALSYRVVYYADDSGESNIFKFLLKKSASGNWQLENLGFSR